MLISDGERVDIRTFDERKDKPCILPDNSDAFSYFMPQMSSHILDMIYNILKLSVSAQSLTLKKTLSSTQSTDPRYITKVVQASKSFADV